MSFLETPRFPLDLAYDTEGGPEYLTEIVVLPSAAEYRNPRRSQPAYRFEGASGVETEEQLYALVVFFHAVGGMLHGWRLRNWSDWKSCSPFGTPTAMDQIIAVATAGQTEFQLIKTYTAGVLSRAVDILKPVPGTLMLAVNEEPVVAGWSLNTANGLILFEAGLNEGDVLTGGYEFDLPCRFGTDYLPRRFKSYLNGEVSVPIVAYRPMS
jgi:uncharacterized protein (TIGR02217 family)